MNKKYNVFVDFHHASLLQSYILLFEKRLGGKVYRPIGLEWAEQGYWHVFDHPFTREQFLSTTLGTVEPPIQMYPDGTRPLNIIDKVEDGIYYCQDIDSGYYNKAITLDKFFELDIDIVIASLPQHIEPFTKLCLLHKNRPKLIYQVGNAWSIENGLAPNIMASATIQNVPRDINFISYHQEFDLNIFKPTYQEKGLEISSFVNCFNVEQFYKNDWALFEEIEQLMPEWTFTSYGGQCRNGAAHGSKEVAAKMNQARFIWHTKLGGDGYGHVIFNSFAVGTPLIVKRAYYNEKMAAPLIEDGVTSICIDNLSHKEIVDKILYYNQPDRYAELCKNSYNRFKKIVDFDKEELLLREFLDKLK